PRLPDPVPTAANLPPCSHSIGVTRYAGLDSSLGPTRNPLAPPPPRVLVSTMAAILHSLQTVVPPTVLVQDEVRDVFAAQAGLTRLAQRIIGTAFGASGIETRHTVLEELTRGS